ncbi:MAG: glycosyltransferase [Planctomycetia bacterium]|nr:glycosyltransferase [Planctomycetia bacterium]
MPTAVPQSPVAPTELHPDSSGPRLAFGPAMPGWGSWEWVGLDLVQELTNDFSIVVFDPWDVPDSDAVVLVKHAPPADWLERLAPDVRLIFCPIDFYPNAAAIADDERFLRRCARVVVHCERLRPYFAPFAPVSYLDHPIKFAAPLRCAFQPTGDLLWVGVRSNLPPLVDWVNRQPLPLPLDVLTNFEDPRRPPTPAELGFQRDGMVRLHPWSAERHLEFAAAARAALDVKADDFRSRHKPPAKAIDFVASGLPLAVNPGGSAAEHLARCGLVLADPRDVDRWLSEGYWRETVQCSRMLRQCATSARVTSEFRRLIAEVVREFGMSPSEGAARLSAGQAAAPSECPRPTDAITVALPRSGEPSADAPEPGPRTYEHAVLLASARRFDEARTVLRALQGLGGDRGRQALIANDLAALAAAEGDLVAARDGLRAALEADPDCGPARANLALLEGSFQGPSAAPVNSCWSTPAATSATSSPPVKVAILSFLFNWPSTGGGIVHTVELAQSLSLAGYDVRHVHVRFPPWQIGEVRAALPFPSEALTFDETDWHAAAIQERFRSAVAAFDPDCVILTDSWNFKPLLAEAVRDWPYFLRLQALECLCPLNNVRLLPAPGGQFRQCGRHQLATPADCGGCVRDHGEFSGALHRAERELSGVGTAEYQERLRRAFAEAEAVLVVNPLAEAMVSPYARAVRVVTAGMDPARFPWPPPQPAAGAKKIILFAGLVDEPMKGFHVVRAAAELLWRRRRDFELVATADPPGQVDPFTRFVGWRSQEDLPQLLWDCALLVMPTVAQEALGRTAVEAMAAGRPVVASRLGGLPFTVADGATGLLFEPGDADDLARKLEQLLDDEPARARLGEAGRRRFEEHYAWPVIVERHYRPLLRRRTPAPPAASHLPAGPRRAKAPGSIRLGCVLAVQDRPPEMLERTLQTYAYQSGPAADRVLLDYGSTPELAAAYQALCERYDWRCVRVRPAEPRWCLSAAYNLAVGALRPEVEVVFKSDVDILLGEGVLAAAARLGRNAFCQFPYFTAPDGTLYPGAFSTPAQLVELFRSLRKSTPSVGQGLFACPAAWFRGAGGFDLEYRTWGYEDHDLRARAEQSLPVVEASPSEALLVHQHHPAAWSGREDRANRDYFERLRAAGTVTRNGGRLLPAATSPAAAATATGRRPRVVFATRSLHEELYRLSDEFLDFDGTDAGELELAGRLRLTGLDAPDYFRALTRLETDWVVNLDEDAFLLDPSALLGLIRHMAANGYAACGMPDGGVVPIRRHNPAACNAYFNVLDLRRVRPVCDDWATVLAAGPRPAHRTVTAPFAARGPASFDHFEDYYGFFFTLLDAGERILYLDAEEWSDGVSTALRGLDGRPFLLHTWYGRDWGGDAATGGRIAAAAGAARRLRRPPPRPVVGDPAPAAPVHESNLGKWDPVFRQGGPPQPFGDTQTYQKAADFLRGLATVEDWGCGWGWFKRYLSPGVVYRGVDGSHSPAADVVADLADYTSAADGILVRHVLEHDPRWAAILGNAVRSFRRRLVLVLFTPFGEQTRALGFNRALGVPDLSFAKTDLMPFFAGLRCSLEEGLRTQTQYGVEHVFYLEKE